MPEIPKKKLDEMIDLLSADAVKLCDLESEIQRIKENMATVLGKLAFHYDEKEEKSE